MFIYLLLYLFIYLFIYFCIYLYIYFTFVPYLFILILRGEFGHCVLVSNENKHLPHLV